MPHLAVQSPHSRTVPGAVVESLSAAVRHVHLEHHHLRAVEAAAAPALHACTSVEPDRSRECGNDQAEVQQQKMLGFVCLLPSDRARLSSKTSERAATYPTLLWHATFLNKRLDCCSTTTKNPCNKTVHPGVTRMRMIPNAHFFAVWRRGIALAHSLTRTSRRCTPCLS